jgi:hypothetical protein
MAAVFLHYGSHPQLAEIFDESMVPWLQRDAEQGASPYARKASLGALGLAGTPAAEEALLDLTHSTDDEIAEAAQRRLDRRVRESGG